MSIQFNPQSRMDTVSNVQFAPAHRKSADIRMQSTIESLKADSDSTKSSFFGSCCLSKIVSKIGRFFGNICSCIKNFFTRSNKGSDSLPKDLLTNMKQLSELLENGDKESILAQISKLPEKKRNEMYRVVYEANKPASPVHDKFGEELVNQNPKDPQIAMAMKGFLAQQEKVVPLEDLLELVENPEASGEVVLDMFNALPTDVRGKNLQKELLYAIWETKAKNTENHDVHNFGEAFLKNSPKDPAVSQAIKVTIDRV